MCKKTRFCSLHSRRTSWSSTPRMSWSSKAICERLWHGIHVTYEYRKQTGFFGVPLNRWILQTQNFQHQSLICIRLLRSTLWSSGHWSSSRMASLRSFLVPLMILFHQFVQGAIGHRPARSGHSCHCQLQGPQGSAGWVVPKEEKRSFKTNQ